MKKFGVNIKVSPAEFKDVDSKQGIVASYPSTFDVVDSGAERVKKGAFARTINSWGPNAKNRIKVLFNHEPWSIIGKPLTLMEDDYGLYAESKIVQTSVGKDVLMLIEEGVITEQSIGYAVVREEKSDDGVKDLLELQLYEYSFLAWGMNMETPILGVKGVRAARFAEDMRRVEKVLHDGAFSTDEVPMLLTRVLKQWQEDVRDFEDNPSVLSIDTSDIEGVKRAITQLQSLLPADPPEGTPLIEDSTKSETDPADGHSEALQKLLKRLETVNTEDAVEMAAARMLRDFQARLGM
jgi:HK97 family phage prohead protease